MDVSTSKEFIKVYEQISQLQSDITAVAKATYDTPIVSYNEIADTPENLSEFNNDVNFVTGEEVDVKIQSMEPVDLSNCLVKCEVELLECEVPTTFTELHATTQDEDDSSSYVATTAFVHSVVQQSGEEVTSRIAGTYNNKDYVTKDNVLVMIEDTIGIHDEEVIAGLIDLKIRAAISGIVIPRNLSELINDLGFITSADIPDSSVVSVNGQTGIVLLDIPTVPTNISSFINDAGYITNAGVTSVNNRTGAVQVQENVQADWSATSGLAKILNKPALKRVATTGDYNDLDNTPTIPTNTSDLYNDSGFLTLHLSLAGYALTSLIPTNVSQLTNDAGYLTQHLSLNGYATVESVTAVQQALNSLIGTNDATTVIDSFNEVVSFLNGVTNTETLSGKLLAMLSDIDNSAPFIIDISPNDTTVPSGTYANAITALRNNRSVVVRLDMGYDNYKYYQLRDDTTDVGGILYFSHNSGAYSEEVMLVADDSISVGTLYNVNLDYGNITTLGVVNAYDSLGNNDQLLFADYSASGLIKKTYIKFDGSTTTQALSKKGTWETFAKSSDIPSTGADINYTGSEPYFLTGGITVDGALDMLDSAIGSVGDNAVGRPSSTTDNAVVRFDGTLGNVQNSGVIINDSNHITAAKFITSGGTSSLFVKGNGSLDNNSYSTSLLSINDGSIILSNFQGSPVNNTLKGNLYISKIDNSLYSSHLRYVVTHKVYSSEDDTFLRNINVAIFTMNYDQSGVQNRIFDGEYAELYIGTVAESELTTSSPYFFVYGSGTLIFSFYGNDEWCPTSISCKVFDRYSNRGWQDVTIEKIGKVYLCATNFVYPCAIKLTYTGQTGTDKATCLVQCEWFRTRSTVLNQSIVTKYPIKQDLYGDIEAPKFIKRGGTSSQFLKADGSVDSNTYATTTYVLSAVQEIQSGDTNVIETVKVNGTALTPDANKAVDVITHDAVVNHGTSDTTFALTPNVMHVWGEVATLTLTLAAATDNTIVNEYMVQFESGATATTLSLPSSITWLATPNIQASKTYQISIVNELGVIAEFEKGGALV